MDKQEQLNPEKAASILNNLIKEVHQDALTKGEQHQDRFLESATTSNIPFEFAFAVSDLELNLEEQSATTQQIIGYNFIKPLLNDYFIKYGTAIAKSKLVLVYSINENKKLSSQAIADENGEKVVNFATAKIAIENVEKAKEAIRLNIGEVVQIESLAKEDFTSIEELKQKGFDTIAAANIPTPKELKEVRGALEKHFSNPENHPLIKQMASQKLDGNALFQKS